MALGEGSSFLARSCGIQLANRVPSTLPPFLLRISILQKILQESQSCGTQWDYEISPTEHYLFKNRIRRIRLLRVWTWPHVVLSWWFP